MKTTNRPEITEELVKQICKTILEKPSMGRSRLSVELCEMWDWRDAGGKVKDMSCRDLLSSFEKAGQIVLPPRIRCHASRETRRALSPSSLPACVAIVYEAAERFALLFPMRKANLCMTCLLYTSDAADEEDSVDLGGRRIIK